MKGSASGLRVPFGVRDGRLYSPGEVENGLGCKCSCPGCGKDLVANHPKVKRPYFSHHNADDCKGGFESAIHMMGKQIISDACMVMIPKISVDVVSSTRCFRDISETVEIQPRSIRIFDPVQEAPIGRFRPDITAKLETGEFIYIEIYVSHKVEDGKGESLENLLEIDLSEVGQGSIETLEDIVIKEAPRKWFRCSIHDNELAVLEARKAIEKDKIEKVLGQKLIETKLIYHGENMANPIENIVYKEDPEVVARAEASAKEMLAHLDEPAAMKGGALARQAGILCQDAEFRLYLDRRRRYKDGLSEAQLPDGTYGEQDARDWLCAACRIQSRAELDHNTAAAEIFMGVQQRFYRWRAKRRATA